jgi:hypothetical protein
VNFIDDAFERRIGLFVKGDGNDTATAFARLLSDKKRKTAVSGKKAQRFHEVTVSS